MTRRKTGLTIAIDHSEAGPLLDAFSALPREMKTAVRDASELIADTEATRLRSAAIADSNQSALVAPSITSKRGDYPTIVAGGSGRIPGRLLWKGQPFVEGGRVGMIGAVILPGCSGKGSPSLREMRAVPNLVGAADPAALERAALR